MWSSAERPERKVTVEVVTLEGSEEGGSPETAETSVAAFEELRHRGRKSTCRRKRGRTLERADFGTMHAKEGSQAGAVNRTDHCEEVSEDKG